MAKQTLEEWLSDLHCGRLRTWAPRERSVFQLVKDWPAFEEKQRGRLRKWPIPCRDCGEYFKPVENPQFVRCPECRERRKAATRPKKAKANFWGHGIRQHNRKT